MSTSNDQVHLSNSPLSTTKSMPMAAAAAALGFALTVFSTVGQDAGNDSPRLLTLALPDSSASEGTGGGSGSPAKGGIDYNDPRVAAAISEAKDNPISELVILWNQFDAIQLHFPKTPLYEEQDQWAYKYQLVPTVPVPLGESWNWVSRLDVPIVSVPLKREVGNLFQLDPVGSLRPNGKLPSSLDPFGRTTGLGDLAYVGLVGPKHLPKLWDGKLILAGGGTAIFPSASEDILGQGKWQAGPSFVAGYIGEHWRFGLFPQQWWSFAGDDRRSAVSQLNLQYFLFYAITPEWEIGMSPNAFVNWNASSGNELTFPIGLGIHHTFNIGQLPVSVGIEAAYSVIHPRDQAGSRWDFRIYIMPLVPAPWGHLAKELRALQ